MNSLFARTTYSIVPLQFDQHLCTVTDNVPFNAKEVVLRRFDVASPARFHLQPVVGAIIGVSRIPYFHAP